MNAKLPPEFEERMKQRLGEEYDAFAEALLRPAEVSVRMNHEKPAPVPAEAEPVPWNSNAWYLPVRPSFVMDPLHHAGSYYVQEASSMLFGLLLNSKKDVLALDLCAAPGGKSTLALSAVSKGSLLISNELVTDRAYILKENLIRWGATNVIATRNRSSDFVGLTGKVDLLLVDAPCSGEGMFRKDNPALQQWNPGLVMRCCDDQRSILTDAVPLLKENGMLIYSTCTFEEAENEEIVQWVHQQFPGILEPVEVPVKEEWGITKKSVQIIGGEHPVYYSYPHKVRGEGLFLSAFRKKSSQNAEGQIRTKKPVFREADKSEVLELDKFAKREEGMVWLMKDTEAFAFPEKWTDILNLAVGHLRCYHYGVKLGMFKHRNFVPAHELAMSRLLNEKVPRINLSLENALLYLKREPFDAGSPGFKGWGIVTYKNVTLGWIKSLGNRVNNYFPQEYKIRKRLDF